MVRVYSFFHSLSRECISVIFNFFNSDNKQMKISSVSDDENYFNKASIDLAPADIRCQVYYGVVS
jgi:septum formation topological specificity factor MinE